MGNSIKEREQFSSHIGFVLACTGSAVGMGNIWRFPIMISNYGGLTFLIPYLIFVALIAKTGVMEEFAFGRAAMGGPVDAFGMAMETKGKRKLGELIGAIPVLGSLGLAIGYTVVMGWITKYTYMSFSGELYSMGSDMDAIGGTFGTTASAGGADSWIIIIAMLTFVILAIGVSDGIERINKILMPALFVLFVILAVYIAFLPGASEGYRYIFTLDPKAMINPELLVFAFGQAFFSLSVAGNGSIIYGSYLPKNESVVKAANRVAIFDTIAAVLATLVILPAMAAVLGEKPESGGPGLMFIYLVKVFNEMPLGRIIGVVFFVGVFFAGISSIINLYEVSVAHIYERTKLVKHNEKGRALASGVIIAVGAFAAILIQAITSQWMDAVSIYICPLGAALAGIMFFWVLGKDFAIRETSMGSDKKLGDAYYYAGKYVYCILAVVALIAGAMLGGIG
ncbi:MAG: sodium-dependent transporter [Clostridia bacterium]|nr:sodium-dependent transporter [Clostridia bacterium]